MRKIWEKREKIMRKKWETCWSGLDGGSSSSSVSLVTGNGVDLFNEVLYLDQYMVWGISGYVFLKSASEKLLALLW